MAIFTSGAYTRDPYPYRAESDNFRHSIRWMNAGMREGLGRQDEFMWDPRYEDDEVHANSILEYVRSQYLRTGDLRRVVDVFIYSIKTGGLLVTMTGPYSDEEIDHALRVLARLDDMLIFKES